MKTAIIEGVYTLAPGYEQWAIPGTFPRRYWDIITYEDEEELAAYLAGQQPYIPQQQPVELVPFGQEAKQARASQQPARKQQPPAHQCERCGRGVKPQYKHCYRCHNYLKVKARIA